MRDLTRRTTLAGVAAAALGARMARADAGQTAWDFTFPAIDEGDLPFARFKGQVLLVTNTASYCGFTYQYKALEALHADTAARGFAVIGVPSQDFGQEKASNGEVKRFCDLTYHVKFPMAGISHVKGPEAAPFYAWVRASRDGWEPAWNFNKVLIARDGSIAGLFRSEDEPGGPKLTAALAQALG
jgi:glutathione peroxidase